MYMGVCNCMCVHLRMCSHVCESTCVLVCRSQENFREFPFIMWVPRYKVKFIRFGLMN